MISKVTSTPLQLKLVEKLKSEGIIKSALVEETMKNIDRADFSLESPYIDSPQKIGYNATISAPHMHAHALVFLSFANTQNCRNC